jgi:hypothetical protein
MDKQKHVADQQPVHDDDPCRTRGAMGDCIR